MDRLQLPANVIDRNEALADAFWALRNVANHSDRIWLMVCLALYALGFGLLFIVLLQNFMYVVRIAM